MKGKIQSITSAESLKKKQIPALNYSKLNDIKQKNFKGDRNNHKTVIVRPR